MSYPCLLIAHCQFNLLIVNNFASCICFVVLQIISLSLSDALLAKLAMPLFEAFSHDPVPNVRFGVAKALENIILNGKEPLTDSTRDMVSFLLTSLKRDEDYDVRFYAEKAWSALE